MIRKAILILLTLGAVVTGGLTLGTLFKPILSTGPQEPGRTAYAIILHRGTLLVHYWRFSDRRKPVVKRINLDPVFKYETDVKRGASQYSEGRVDPRRYQLSVGDLGLGGTLVLIEAKLSLWLVAVFVSAYPTLAFIRGPLRRHRRRKRGLCLKCGYNLTGNTSGVCPECGAKIGTQA